MENNTDRTRVAMPVDPALPVDPELNDGGCPKCGAEMEPIEADVPGLAVEHLKLCPSCYLVTWSDHDGIHIRQGVPMKEGAFSSSESPAEVSWSSRDPEKC
jgi:hypothetical protein